MELLKKQSKKQDKKSSRKRIHALDEIRGFAVFCMVFYHAFYTIGILFNVPFFVKLLNFFMPVEPLFAAAFIVISGISSNLSHSNLLRGGKLLCVALALTLVTYIAVPSSAIYFGVLHLLSVCMLLYGVLQKPISKIPMNVGLGVCFVLFFLTYSVSAGVLGVKGLFGLALPDELYKSDWLFMFGFPNSRFTSSDYFPLLPWVFAFFFGTFLGRLAQQERFPKFMYKKHIPFFSLIGRHALIIYVLHQPVIYGAAYLVKWIVTGSF